MIKPIVRDAFFLNQKSEKATKVDLPITQDLEDTLKANRQGCVGMAANMIGERKRVIAFYNGPVLMVMVNPKIIKKSGEYTTEEGCLSLAGIKSTKRWQEITVSYQDESFRPHTNTFRGYPAQIIQHECDHCEGILI